VGALLFRAGRDDEAIAQLQQGLAQSEPSASILERLVLAMALARRGLGAEARRHWQAALGAADRVRAANSNAFDWEARLEGDLLTREGSVLLSRESGH
jgi:hypothetical protein